MTTENKTSEDSLKIPKGYGEVVYGRWTDNAVDKRKDKRTNNDLHTPQNCATRPPPFPFPQKQ